VKVLDELRGRFNVMTQALKQQHEAQLRGCSTHKLALATFALQRALEEGRPFTKEVAELRVCSIPRTVTHLPSFWLAWIENELKKKLKTETTASRI
jgi:hypothetical protein